MMMEEEEQMELTRPDQDEPGVGEVYVYDLVGIKRDQLEVSSGCLASVRDGGSLGTSKGRDRVLSLS